MTDPSTQSHTNSFSGHGNFPSLLPILPLVLVTEVQEEEGLDIEVKDVEAGLVTEVVLASPVRSVTEIDTMLSTATNDLMLPIHLKMAILTVMAEVRDSTPDLRIQTLLHNFNRIHFLHLLLQYNSPHNSLLSHHHYVYLGKLMQLINGFLTKVIHI